MCDPTDHKQLHFGYSGTPNKNTLERSEGINHRKESLLKSTLNREPQTLPSPVWSLTLSKPSSKLIFSEGVSTSSVFDLLSHRDTIQGPTVALIVEFRMKTGGVDRGLLKSPITESKQALQLPQAHGNAHLSILPRAEDCVTVDLS